MKMWNEKGFTLIEMMVAIVISSIATIGAYNIFISQQKAYMIQEQVADMQQNARVAIDLMMREIRMAGYDPTEANTPNVTPIVTATQTLIRIQADLDEDGSISNINEDEDVTFALNNSDIFRNTGGVNQPLVINIVNLVFAYFDENAALIAYDEIDDVSEQVRRDDIRQISISVIARTEKEDSDWQGYNSDGTLGGGYRIRPFTVNVRPRNLGLRLEGG